jgi:hypothetical protein
VRARGPLLAFFAFGAFWGAWGVLLPDVKEKLNAIGLTVVTESPEYFGKLLKSDYEKYGKLIRDIGFKPQ